MRSRRSGYWALGDFINSLYIYIRARLEGGLQTQNTKITIHKKNNTVAV